MRAWGFKLNFPWLSGWFWSLLILLIGVWAWSGSSSRAQSPVQVFQLTPESDLQASLNQAQILQAQGSAVTLIFAPGHYHQTGILRSSADGQGKPLPPITLTTASLGTVIFTGGEAWTDWTSTKQPGIYRHDWPFVWGFSGNPWLEHEIDFPLLMQRGELAWINQQRLEPGLVGTELKPGQFAIDEAHQEIRIALPEKIDPETAQVEVSTRRNGLTLDQAENILIENLIFEHYGGTFTGALNVNQSKNINIEHCQFFENNWAGLNIDHTQGITVAHSLSADNGMRGLGGAFISDLIVEQVESRGNNWRGKLAGWYDWDAREKYFYLRRARFNNYRALNNYSAGLWFDSDYQEVVIDQSQFMGNAVTGLFIEAGPGPITVKDSVIIGNYSVGDKYLQTPGLFAWAAANVTLENNVIAGNLGPQIGIRDLYIRNIKIPEKNTTETFISRNWHLKNNWIMATRAQEWLVSTLNAEAFLDSLQSQANRWFSYAPQPFGIQGQRATFAEWRVKTQADQDSLFVDLHPQQP